MKRAIKTGSKLLLITNRNMHTCFRLAVMVYLVADMVMLCDRNGIGPCLLLQCRVNTAYNNCVLGDFSFEPGFN